MAKEMSANRTVTPNEAKKSIRRAIKKQRPIFMWGAPGIGKSDIVKQIADEQHKDNSIHAHYK
jgi:MoxR-like ATPase